MFKELFLMRQNLDSPFRTQLLFTPGPNMSQALLREVHWSQCNFNQLELGMSHFTDYAVFFNIVQKGVEGSTPC